MEEYRNYIFFDSVAKKIQEGLFHHPVRTDLGLCTSSPTYWHGPAKGWHKRTNVWAHFPV